MLFLNKNAKLQKRYNRKLSYVLTGEFVTNENEKYRKAISSLDYFTGKLREIKGHV